jgi:hypothetical protein
MEDILRLLRDALSSGAETEGSSPSGAPVINLNVGNITVVLNNGTVRNLKPSTRKDNPGGKNEKGGKGFFGRLKGLAAVGTSIVSFLKEVKTLLISLLN